MKTGMFRKNRYWIATAAISFLTALAVFLPAIIKDRGFFLIVDDFNAQQLPFATAVRYALYARPLGDWFWGIDLGTSLVNTFGFYNLGSPFFWISLLFPDVTFPYLAGWLYILKYVVAAVSAHLYLRRFVKDERFALIGALLYAFSGFQSTNLMFFHFHDVTAFFPLLLLALEKVMEDRKYRPFFIFTVFLNCLVNYFFFIGEVVFLIPYFLVRFRSGSIRTLLRAGLARLLDGLLGVGMAFVLFLPSVLYVLNSARSEFSLTLENAFYGVRDVLVILKGLFLPGDLMNDWSALVQTNWNSTSAYLPLFGLSFVFAYLLRRKDRLCLLLLLGLVFCFFPFLQSAFYLFADVYQRWWYMLVLLFALATVKVLEDPASYRIGLGVCLNAAVVAALYLVVRFLYRDGSSTLVFHGKRFLLEALVAAGAPLLVWGLIKLRWAGWKRLVLLSTAFCFATTAMTLHAYRKLNVNENYREFFEGGLLMETLDEQYRYRASGMLMTTNGKAAAYLGFCSTLENSSYAFDELFDIHSTNMTRDRSKVRGLAALLGAKFRMTTEPSEEDRAVEYLDHNGTIYYLVTYTKSCPIGFALDRYLTVDRLKALPVNERPCALMHAFVVEPEQAAQVAPLAEPFDPDTVDLPAVLIDAIDACKANAVFDFHRDNTGFWCRTAYEKDRFVYFTVPYDRGWKATIDGESAEILCSGGMMLLRVPAGEHAVRFVYHTPGLRAGAIVSGVSWLVFAGVCVLVRTAAKRKRGDDEKFRETEK